MKHKKPVNLAIRSSVTLISSLILPPICSEMEHADSVGLMVNMVNRRNLFWQSGKLTAIVSFETEVKGNYAEKD